MGAGQVFYNFQNVWNSLGKAPEIMNAARSILIIKLLKVFLLSNVLMNLDMTVQIPIGLRRYLLPV